MSPVKSPLAPVESNKKILIGTVGYHILGNHSVGPLLMSALQEMEWSPGTEIAEMNWGPIAIVQQFQSMTEPFDRVVFLTAVERPHRKTGDITVHRWMGGLPSDEQIQACIGDAVTGVISPENLLVIGEHFKIWPQELYIVDVEPGPEKTGIALTPEVEARVDEILDTVRRIGLHGASTLDAVNYLSGSTLISN